MSNRVGTDGRYGDRDGVRQPRRRPRYHGAPRPPLWARLLVVVGTVLLMGSIGSVAVWKLAFGVLTQNVKQQNLLGDQGTQGQRRAVSITGAKNILLVGLDSRPNQNPDDPVRADSILVLHVDAGHDHAYLVSIPRDTWVRIPGFPATRFAGQPDRINAAYAFGHANGGGAAGGVQLLAQTIRTSWGIGFDAAAIVDFQGFEQVVGVLGGVCMDIDERTVSVHVGTNIRTGRPEMPYRINAATGQVIGPVPGVRPKVYDVGPRCLQPYEALDYVRQRELLPNGDYDRQRHQQQFLRAVVKKILSPDILAHPLTLERVIDSVGAAMTIDPGRGLSIEDWVVAMRGIGLGDLVTLKTNRGTFHRSPANPDAESLDDATLDLLAAVRTDTVDQYAAHHPDLLIAG